MNLLKLEQEVKQYLYSVPDLKPSELDTRFKEVLNFITNLYNKHGEEVSVDDAYKCLYRTNTNEL